MKNAKDHCPCLALYSAFHCVCSLTFIVKMKIIVPSIDDLYIHYSVHVVKQFSLIEMCENNILPRCVTVRYNHVSRPHELSVSSLW